MVDPKAKKLLLGLGFDAKDEHKRISRGKNFFLAGGSKDTHACMQEKAIKFNEELNRRGKSLDQVCDREFREIAHDLDMHIPVPKDKE